MVRGFLVAIALLTGVGTAGAESAVAKSFFKAEKLADYSDLHAQLMKAKRATVSADCGSVMWPWAYRGQRGSRMTLRPYATAEVDARWTADFVAALFREAGWDSVEKFRGRSKPCDQIDAAPLFVVTLKGAGPDLYALLSFETRSAQIFQPEKPLGTVWFSGRVDTVFALIRQALASDSLVAAMRTPPEDSLLAVESLRLTQLDSVPEAVLKVPPSYPDAARENGISGTILVQALVGTGGRVEDAFVRGSYTKLDDAALEAVWQWRFRPAYSKGKPIPIWVGIPVRFTLH